MRLAAAGYSSTQSSAIVTVEASSVNLRNLPVWHEVKYCDEPGTSTEGRGRQGGLTYVTLPLPRAPTVERWYEDYIGAIQRYVSSVSGVASFAHPRPAAKACQLSTFQSKPQT